MNMQQFLTMVRLLFVVATSLASLAWLSRRTNNDRRFTGVMLGSYGVRVAIAIALFYISLRQLPILQHLQTGQGFWALGPDAQVYDYYGLRIVDAWKKGIELPRPELAMEYVIVVALIYKFFGAHPLHAILINCWLAVVNGLLAYRIAKSVFDRRVASIAALLVGCWPSSFLWSSQLLKDTLSWFLILSVLLLLVRIVAAERRQSINLFRWVLLCGVLALVTILLTRLRFYIGSALLAAVTTVMFPAAVHGLIHRRIGRSLRYAAVAAIVALSLLIARTLEIHKLISPAHPEVGHQHLAMAFWQQGGLSEAEGEFKEALSLNRRYKEAHLGLSALYVQMGQLEEAVNAYAAYLPIASGEERVEIRQMIGRLYAAIGERHLRSKRFLRAADAYEQSLLYEPDASGVFAQLAAAMAGEYRVSESSQLLSQLQQSNDTPETRAGMEAVSRQVAKEEGATEEEGWQREQDEEDVVEAAASSMAVSNMRARAARITDGSIELSPGVIAAAHEQTTPAVSTYLTRIEMPVSGGAEATVVLSEASEEKLVDLALSMFSRSSKQTYANVGRRSRRRLQTLADSFSRLHDEARSTVKESTPGSLDCRRRGFVSSGGYSLVDPSVTISSPQQLLAYLPRALTVGILGPFPNQWFDTRGSTGMMRALACLEMMLIYGMLLCGLVPGLRRLLRDRPLEGWLIVGFIVFMAIPVSLVVANIGTLFRLRLQFLLPLLIVNAAGLVWILDRLREFRRRWKSPVPTFAGSGSDSRRSDSVKGLVETPAEVVK